MKLSRTNKGAHSQSDNALESSSLHYTTPSEKEDVPEVDQEIEIGCLEEFKRDLSELENYQREYLKMIKVPIKDKLEALNPYNIFLTTVKDSPETHKELTSISFLELLDPYFGELECSLQINCLVEFEFLISHYNFMGYKCKPLTLLYNQVDLEPEHKFKDFVTHAKVKCPNKFGCHHSKMMVFHYKDKSVRIVMTTANLIEDEWINRTQGLWISPKCPALPSNSDTGAGESVTNFKHDLLQYLSAYNLSELQPWLEILQDVDMSEVRVFFVASVPGTHTIDKNNWGMLKLGKVLSEQIETNNGNVIAQCSSIGSLGPNPSSWLQGDMLSVFTSAKEEAPSSPSPLKLIYPTYRCISKSYDGLLGGSCFPYSKRTHTYQKWLVSYLCDWYSEKRHRTRAPPHIKSYCRVSEDERKLYYFLLTSANISKAAWGQKNISDSLKIHSYEAGVVLVPQLLVGQDYFPLTKEGDGSVKLFLLPYDLPLVPYRHCDTPWFIDNLK